MTTQHFLQRLAHSGSLTFSRQTWANLRTSKPYVLDIQKLMRLRGYHEPLNRQEMIAIYQPLTELLHAAYQQARYNPTTPYIIGIVGSVAVGKSTLARVLQYLLTHHPVGKKVDLVTTDGFLHTNETLLKRGLMYRKGFPESYDLPRLIRFLEALKAGASHLCIPTYSHHHYDIIPDQYQTIQNPDILILEGLNLLQKKTYAPSQKQIFVSDFLDLSIYLDADIEWIKTWYIDRFLNFRERARDDQTAFFHQFTTLNDGQARDFADYIWETINAKNLKENIQPYRTQANVRIDKGKDHLVEQVHCRTFALSDSQR